MLTPNITWIVWKTAQVQQFHTCVHKRERAPPTLASSATASWLATSVDTASFFTNAQLVTADIAANLADGMYQGHYHGKEYHSPDLDAVLARAWASGVEKIIITAGTLSDARAALALACTDPRLFCTVGVHPTRCSEFEEHAAGPEAYLAELKEVHRPTPNPFLQSSWCTAKVVVILFDCRHRRGLPRRAKRHRSCIMLCAADKRTPVCVTVSWSFAQVLEAGRLEGKVVAVGEVGLDYDRLQFCSKAVQKTWFQRQFELVAASKLPMFLHSRAAADDLAAILSEQIKAGTFTGAKLALCSDRIDAAPVVCQATCTARQGTTLWHTSWWHCNIACSNLLLDGRQRLSRWRCALLHWLDRGGGTAAQPAPSRLHRHQRLFAQDTRQLQRDVVRATATHDGGN
jgi:Tat protein secretion system quality control protein TatD with DNase activity